MMIMNEKAIRFLMGLDPQVWETHCRDWKETYTNRSSDVAAMMNDWEGYKITHLSMPETGIVAIWLEDK